MLRSNSVVIQTVQLSSTDSQKLISTFSKQHGRMRLSLPLTVVLKALAANRMDVPTVTPSHLLPWIPLVWSSTLIIPVVFSPTQMVLLTLLATSGTARCISSLEINRLRAPLPSMTQVSCKATTSPPSFHQWRCCPTKRSVRSLSTTVVPTPWWLLLPPSQPPSPPYSSELDH